MHSCGITQLYEPGFWLSLDPILRVGFVANVLRRAPLIPCFISANEMPTIPFCKRHIQRSKFPHGRADTRADRGDGSKLYEVNMWLWNFGRGMPRRNSVADDEMIRDATLLHSRQAAWETRRRSK